MITTCQARPPASGSRSYRTNQDQSSPHVKSKSKFNSKKTPSYPPRKITNYIPDANSQLQCPHFAECSGCTLDANLSTPPILERASSFFQETLGYENFQLHAGPPQGWRQRARLAVRSSMPDIFGNNLTLPCVGLFRERSHDIVNIPKCTVHHPALNLIADLIRLCITICEIEPYNEESGKGQLRYIQLALADIPPPPAESSSSPGGQQQDMFAVQVVLVWNAPDVESAVGLEDFAETLWLQAAAKLALALTKKTESVAVALHSIHANFQPLKTNAILGPNPPVLLHGSSESWTRFTLSASTTTTTTTTTSGTLSSGNNVEEEEKQGLITVPISFDPNSFMQANPGNMTMALQSMRSWIKPGSNVVDLHAGIGTIGLVLARVQKLSSLKAVEINPSAEISFWKSYKRLKNEESANNSSGGCSLPEQVEYFVAAAGSDPEKFLNGADVAILDPPRKGIEPELLDYFCSTTTGSNRILYLSCGFPAFERDCLKLLDSGKWKMVSAEAFLFFPGADHIETLAVFDRI